MKYHPVADIPGLNESHCLTSHRECRPSGAVVKSVEEPVKGYYWIRNQLTSCLYTSLWTFLLGIAGLQRLDRHETSPSK